MSPYHASIYLPDVEATAALATGIGRHLVPGDVLGLEGPVGAGKSFFARALIQSAQDRAGQVPEDVPSPTFTLVQSYLVDTYEIWHCDLYRLTRPQEALELGLEDAFESAICLIEWPDRLGDAWPASRALTCNFALGEVEQARSVTLTGVKAWAPRLSSIAL